MVTIPPWKQTLVYAAGQAARIAIFILCAALSRAAGPGAVVES